MWMCRIISCIVGKHCFLWPVCSLDKTVSHCSASFCAPRPNLPVTLDTVTLGFLLLQSNSLWWKVYLVLVLILESLAGSHRSSQLQILQHYWLGIDLITSLLWCWMVCLGNKPSSFCLFEIAMKYYISDSWLTMRATPFLLRDSCPQ